MASGIQSATEQLETLLEATRVGYGRIFGPAPGTGGPPPPGVAEMPQAATTEAQLNQLLARLHQTVDHLEAVSYALMRRL